MVFLTKVRNGILFVSLTLDLSGRTRHCANKITGGSEDTPGDDKCSCPRRVGVPDRPKVLPFPARVENNEHMKENFSGSTFNTCPHQKLPCMAGPEVQIHIDDNVQPKACHTPASIPIHWQEQVHADLLREEAPGVIEKVPYVEWCRRMVISRKHDGSPRRTADLSPLNKYCKRETYSSESPFRIV